MILADSAVIHVALFAQTPCEPLRKYQISSGVHILKKRKLRCEEVGWLGQEYIANSMANLGLGSSSPGMLFSLGYPERNHTTIVF